MREFLYLQELYRDFFCVCCCPGLYVGNLKGGLKMGKYIWNLYVNRFYTKRNLVLFVILWIAFDSFYAEIDYACKVLDYPCSFWYFLNVMTNHFMCGAIGLSAVYLF